MMIKNPLNNKKGSIALYSVIIMCVVLPMMIFLAVDLPFLLNVHRKAKNVLDNAGSSAILALDEAELALGRLTVIEPKAQSIIYRLIASEFKLDPVTLEPLDGSYVTKKPRVEIRVINNPTSTVQVRVPEQTMSDAEKFDDIYVDETSVVIYMDLEIQSLFFRNYKPRIEKATAAQSQFAF